EGLKKKIFEEEIKYSKNILKYLMVIHKETGLTIYEKGFYGTEFDPDLIGGFLTAIQNFGSEISSQETAMKKLVYKDFQIELEDGDYIRAALILNGEPTKYLIKNLLKFVNSFENTFRDELQDWAGNLKIFREKEDALSDLFS
ncbi:MAG: hypothetical protein ACTSVY_08420, partial [Candidatus Helarchaeota archaeon]